MCEMHFPSFLPRQFFTNCHIEQKAMGAKIMIIFRKIIGSLLDPKRAYRISCHAHMQGGARHLSTAECRGCSCGRASALPARVNQIPHRKVGLLHGPN